MPHLTIGYSANLDGKVEMVGLCRALLAAILASGLFEMGAIRVRAVRCAAYAVADLLAENAFADLRLRIGAGRSAADKARAGRRSIRCMRPRCGVYRDRSRRGGHCGGGRCQIRGAGGGYVSPTLFTGAHNQMRIAQEEIFGPVLTAIPFKDEAEALALANDVQYVLTGYLWTSDVTRAFRFTDALEAGMIWANSENIRHLPAPFGGVKNSGIGRDGPEWSFDFYMETKNIAFATQAHAIPKLGG